MKRARGALVDGSSARPPDGRRPCAASTAARSPNALSSARLSGACGQIAGALGSSASNTSVTAGRTSYSTCDRFCAIAGRRDAFGHHHGDRLADEAHALDRERQLRLVEDLAVGRRRERRHLDVDRVGRIREVRHADEAVVDIVAAGQHRDHARQLARGGRVDAQDARMGVRCPHEHRVGLAAAATCRRCSGPARAPAADPRSAASAGRCTARAPAPSPEPRWLVVISFPG